MIHKHYYIEPLHRFVFLYVNITNRRRNFNWATSSAFTAGGKPSTWFPPGRLVEQSMHKQGKPGDNDNDNDNAHRRVHKGWWVGAP